jgi:hypothetical protein
VSLTGFDFGDVYDDDDGLSYVPREYQQLHLHDRERLRGPQAQARRVHVQLVHDQRQVFHRKSHRFCFLAEVGLDAVVSSPLRRRKVGLAEEMPIKRILDGASYSLCFLDFLWSVWGSCGLLCF